MEQIQHLLKQYHERGNLTRIEFCENRGISPSTLDYYLRRHGKRVAPVRLARVEVQEPAQSGCFALVLANGRRIECGEAGLAQLIRAAEVA